MKVEILMNGTTKIVLLPENPIEIAILENISKSDVSARMIKQQTQILDKVVQEALVVSTKSVSVTDFAKKDPVADALLD